MNAEEKRAVMKAQNRKKGEKKIYLTKKILQNDHEVFFFDFSSSLCNFYYYAFQYLYEKISWKKVTPWYSYLVKPHNCIPCICAYIKIRHTFIIIIIIDIIFMFYYLFLLLSFSSLSGLFFPTQHGPYFLSFFFYFPFIFFSCRHMTFFSPR